MKLKKFIKKFIEPNTLIRLWYKIKDGHEQVFDNKVQMEWEVALGYYAKHEIIGITDILMIDGICVEAVNIVIEK